MAGRKHREAAQLLPRVAGQRIEQRQRFQLVVEQRDAHRALGVFRREDVDHVAAHAIHAALEVHLVALVLHLGQARMTSRWPIFSPTRRCRIMLW
jgi:hypothetical protein